MHMLINVICFIVSVFYIVVNHIFLRSDVNNFILLWTPYATNEGDYFILMWTLFTIYGEEYFAGNHL